MKNKILLTILLGLFLISFTSAMTCDGILPGSPFKVGNNITLKEICSSCTYVTLSSITYPNSTTLTINENMTQTGIEYNYTFYTDTNGDYSYVNFGDKDGIITSDTICFSVNPTGTIQTTSQGIGSLAFLGLMIILMFCFGWVGFELFKNKNLWVIGVFFEFLAVLMLVYNTWLGYEYHNYSTGLPVSNIPEIIFYIFLLIIVLGLLVSAALLFLNWKKVFKYIKKEIKRNEGDDDKDVEDWDFKEYDEK